jgi:2-phospho-L-lactate/phosphoenolpyruvate guanylyltransferase
MKSLAIVIPVKRPEHGKSRLAGALLPSDRLALTRSLLRHTFTQAAGLADIADIYVMSKSAEVRADAARRGFQAYEEPAACDLNGAIAIGADRARQAGSHEIMVLPLDLPKLSSLALRGLVEQLHSGLDVLIISDHAGTGTNVLLWRPLASAVFHYGASSAQAHARHAELLGLRLAIRVHPALSFDIDTPDDLAHWMRDGRASLVAGAKS